jgi:hypothetical protein
MDQQEIANIIIGLRDADLALREKLVQSRELFDGYHPDMEQLHLRNAEILIKLLTG